MTSPVSGRPLPSSFDEDEEFYNESGFQKVMRRMKREPLVPLGCLLTVAAFTNAYIAMRKGDHHQVQRMFRARVLAQGFTVAVMVAGGLYFGAERHKERELWKLQQEEKAEEKRQKWIRELEARDEEEKDLKAHLQQRRMRKKAADAEAARASFRAADAKKRDGDGDGDGDGAAASAEASEAREAQGQKKADGSGWGLPWWSGGSKSSDPSGDSPQQAKNGPDSSKK